MIYLNHAGTSWPKPPEVSEAIHGFMGSSPEQWPGMFQESLEAVTQFFNIKNKDRFIFTSSCTSSLAIALSDFPWEKGDRLIISAMEHHALSRWFFKVQREHMVEGIVIPRGNNTPIDLDILENELQKGAKLVAVSMASNVTGEILPYEEIISLSHKYGTKCLLDGAQLAGIEPIDIKKIKPDIFVFAGHKGPLGIQGVGGLYISESLSMVCPSAVCEIAPGSKPHSIMPTYCDTGSANMPGLIALKAGVKWIEKQGFEKLVKRRKQLTSKLRNGLAKIDQLEVLGSSYEELTTGAISIKPLGDLTPHEISEKLWEKYQIKVGVGFQCAPMAHEALGTEQHGVIRISVGVYTTMEEVSFFLSSLEEIVKSDMFRTTKPFQ